MGSFLSTDQSQAGAAPSNFSEDAECHNCGGRMNPDLLGLLLREASEGFARGLVYGIDRMGNGSSIVPPDGGTASRIDLAQSGQAEAAFSEDDFAPGLADVEPEEVVPGRPPTLENIMREYRQGGVPLGHYDPRAARNEMQPWMEAEAEVDPDEWAK